MKPKTSFAISLLSLLCILLFTGCAGTVEESPAPTGNVSPSVQPMVSPSPEETEGQTVALSIYFRRTDGTPLTQSVRLSDGETGRKYPLDEEGRLQITGIPKTGAYTVSVLEDNEEAGAITLNLSVGSVIDAATDADGIGHVILREDTEMVALDLVLDEDGTLTCSLRLSANDGQGTNVA